MHEKGVCQRENIFRKPKGIRRVLRNPVRKEADQWIETQSKFENEKIKIAQLCEYKTVYANKKCNESEFEEIKINFLHLFIYKRIPSRSRNGKIFSMQPRKNHTAFKRIICFQIQLFSAKKIVFIFTFIGQRWEENLNQLEHLNLKSDEIQSCAMESASSLSMNNFTNYSRKKLC
jgi:hypothetical protein